MNQHQRKVKFSSPVDLCNNSNKKLGSTKMLLADIAYICSTSGRSKFRLVAIRHYSGRIRPLIIQYCNWEYLKYMVTQEL